MRLVASDFITHQRPSPCDLRVWLRHRGEPEREPTEFEKVLYRLGERHAFFANPSNLAKRIAMEWRPCLETG